MNHQQMQALLRSLAMQLQLIAIHLPSQDRLELENQLILMQQLESNDILQHHLEVFGTQLVFFKEQITLFNNLTRALFANNFDEFQSLLQAHPKLAHMRASNTATALITAAQRANTTRFIQSLLEAGSDINYTDEAGRSPLLLSVSNNHLNNARLLLQFGANPGLASKNGWTPLYVAANKSNLDMVAELLKPEYSTIDIINHTNTVGGTALMQASMNGHLTIVRKLIENGAEVNINDNNKWCALMKAADKGHAKVIKTLIDAHADINAADRMGSTALMLAVKGGRENAAKALLDTTGIEIDKQDLSNRTALFFAVEKKNIALMKILLSKGANLNIEDKNKKTAFLLALNNPETCWELMNVYQDEIMLNDPHKLLTIDALFNFYDSIDTSNPHYNDAQMRIYGLLQSFEANDETQRIELLEKKLCCVINSGQDKQLIDNLYNDLCGRPYSNELKEKVIINAMQGSDYWINRASTIRNETMQTNNNEAIKISQASNAFFAHESSATSTNTAANTSVFNPG